LIDRFHQGLASGGASLEVIGGVEGIVPPASCRVTVGVSPEAAGVGGFSVP
jgi:hypothetical protein